MARALVENGALNNPSINLESLLDDCRRHGEKQIEKVLLQQESTGPEECIQSLLAFLDKILSETSIFKRNIENEEIRFTTARRRVERSRYSIYRNDKIICIVDSRNGELISRRKIELYIEFIEEVERHARSVLKYFYDQPEQVLQYAQNHSPIKDVLGFVNGLQKQVNKLTRSERPKFLSTLFQSDSKNLLRYFFDPAVEFVGSLENRVN